MSQIRIYRKPNLHNIRYVLLPFNEKFYCITRLNSKDGIKYKVDVTTESNKIPYTYYSDLSELKSLLILNRFFEKQKIKDVVSYYYIR